MEVTGRGRTSKVFLKSKRIIREIPRELAKHILWRKWNQDVVEKWNQVVFME